MVQSRITIAFVVAMTLLISGVVSAQSTVTLYFDGAEPGITPGATSFAYQGSHWEGGVVTASGVEELYASGIYCLHYENAPGSVVFDAPVDRVRFHYVYQESGPYGGGQGVATAYAADNSTLGFVTSNIATTYNDAANYVELDPATPISRIEFSAGVLDSFTYTTEAAEGEGEGEQEGEAVYYQFPLDGEQETDDTLSPFAGCGTVVVSPDRDELYVFVSHDVPDATTAHIHRGGPDVAGPVVFPLSVSENPIETTIEISEADYNDLVSGNFYINIHTPANPAGEIRGQIVQAACGRLYGTEVPVTDVLGLGVTIAALATACIVEYLRGRKAARH